MAVGLYLAVTRAILLVVVVVPALYFVLNSSPFPGQLTRFLRTVLPGPIEIGSVQISPIPWKVDILGVRISTPDGASVIEVERLGATVDLVPLVRWVTGKDSELLLHLREVRLFDYDVQLNFDTLGHLKLVDAFSAPKDPNTPRLAGPKRPLRLVFDRVVGDRGSCHLSFTDWDVDVKGIDLDARFELSNVPTMYIKVISSRVSWTDGIGHIRAAPDATVIPRTIEMGPGGAEGFVYDWDRISFQHATFALPGLGVESRNGFFAWSENLRYEGEVDLDFAKGSPLIDQAFHGVVNGPLHLSANGKGDVFNPRLTVDMSSPGMSVSGFDLGRVAMAFSGGNDETGRYALRGISLVTDSSRGKVKLDGGVFHPFGSTDELAMDAAFALDIEGLNLPTLLRDLGVEPPSAKVPLPRTMSGRLQVRADVVSWATMVASAQVSGSLEGLLSQGTVMAGSDLSVKLDASVGVAGDFTQPSIRIDALEVRSGSDAGRVKGTVDLMRRQLDLSGSVEKDLKPLLSALGMRGRGLAALTDLRVRGSFKAPVATAVATATGLIFDPWEVDHAKARVAWKDGAAILTALDAVTPYGTVTADEVAVRVLDSRTGRRLPSTHLSVRNASAQAVDLNRLPPLKGRGVTGKASLVADRLDLDFGNPLRSLDGAVVVKVPLVTWDRRKLNDVTIEAKANRGVLNVSSAKGTFRSGGGIKISGDLDLSAGRFNAALDGTGLSLAVLIGQSPGQDPQGILDVHATASGPLLDPEVKAHVDAKGVAYKDWNFGDLSIDATRESGGNLLLSSDRFLPRMNLNEASGLTWDNGRFTGLNLIVDLNGVTAQDIWPPLKPRDLWGQLTGNLVVRMGFGAGSTLSATLTSPPDGLRLAFFDREVMLKNVENLVVSVHDNAVSVSGLALDDGRAVLRACGQPLDPDGQMRLWVRGAVGAYWLRHYNAVFSVSDGYVRLSGVPGAAVGAPPVGCGPNGSDGENPLVITGTYTNPLADGEIRINGIELGIRSLGEALRFLDGGRIILSSTDGRLRASIPQDGWVKGTFGDGAFSLHGGTAFDGLKPVDGELIFDGTGIRYAVEGEYAIVGNPSVIARLEGLDASGQPRMRITGRVAVTEGQYHKNFDIMKRAFSGLYGTKVADRQGGSSGDGNSWLTNADLDLAVTGSKFVVRTRMVVGSTDFEIAMDLRVKGKVKAPELWNRLEILPTGTVTYELVRRVFEVVRGTVDFDGPGGRPRVDLIARTNIRILNATTQNTAVASRFDPDAPMSGSMDQGIIVSLKVTGRYPDLDISLSSPSSAYSQSDLQYLVLTGSMPQGGSGGSTGQAFSLGLLTDATTHVSQLLLGSLVDAINLGVGPSGGVNVDVSAHLGTRLNFETQVQQTSGAGQAWYTAGFHVRLTDRLSLEGRVLSGDQTTFNQSLDPGNKYETKLRFKIPIE